MSYIDVIPTVRSLSPSDKLRLIQWLAGDLAGIDQSFLTRSAEIIDSVDETEAMVRKVGLANAIGRAGTETLVVDEDGPMTASVENNGRDRGPLPIRFPDESYEAASILLRALEEEKSSS